MDYDLTTEEGVVAYMREATSTSDWNNRCDKVKRANGGDYPKFWFKAIVLSGVMLETTGEGSNRIKIGSL